MAEENQIDCGSIIFFRFLFKKGVTFLKKAIGIRKEVKNKWERRTPLTPGHISQIIKNNNIDVYVQPSEIRIFPDEEYKNAGAKIQEDICPSKIVFAVKEVPAQSIEEGKIYINFAHVIKGQHYNMPVLKRYMDQKCVLIDYEKITDEKGRRIIFFGKHAGIVGMMDTLWLFGKRLESEGKSNPFRNIKQTVHYKDLPALEEAVREAGELITKEGIDESLVPLTCGFAGYGNVSKGAQQVLDLLPVIEIEPEKLLRLKEKKKLSNKHIYKVVFKEKDMVKPLDPSGEFQLQDYYDNPGKYKGIFEKYIPHLTILMNAIYWTARYPRLVTRSLIKKLSKDGNKPKLEIIGDISCDVDGAIEFNTHCTNPGHPAYTFNSLTGKNTPGVEGDGVIVLAVDNLPCELAAESSKFFGDILIKFIPGILSADRNKPLDEAGFPEEIKRAVIVYNGELTPDFKYLEEYLDEYL